MLKAYIVFAALVCASFGYASHIGWTLEDALRSGRWNPHGPHAHGGHTSGRSGRMYHK